ncbi:ferritin-like domain-containing protein [Pleionea sediminis]|uniref:ferritin-like domain-containing protein n=1 Tax=Pleionea sediminis TaxID=2569479 RepID=UPI00118489C0|nr:ferritin-like domain-containing protein [Pleionea sediminis]
MYQPDPLFKLTSKEKKLVKTLEDDYTREELLAKLKKDLQIAVEIELATLPIYLYTYYSINRQPNITAAKETDLNLFANKAGGIIMSVAVEEMLHMSLAANILFALGVKPKVYGKSPNFNSIPGGGTNLPFHKKKGPDKKPIDIKLEGFGLQSMWNFLEIEYPKEAKDKLKDNNWDTIGDFYSYIRAAICTKHITDDDFSGPAKFQISNDYYSQNCIDTIYPKSTYQASNVPGESESAAKTAVFPNSSDSHAGPVELIKVTNKYTAITAITTICDQGEGFAIGGKYKEEPTDDQSKTEDSHYYKFLLLQSQLEGYDPKHEAVAPHPKAPDPADRLITETELNFITYPYPENPFTSDYPENLHELSNLCNAIYQYMLLMTEATYTVSGVQQVELFNVGMHKAMIWVLDKLIQGMRTFTCEVKDKSGKDGKTTIECAMAPTFENIDIISNGQPAKLNVLSFFNAIKEKAAKESADEASKSSSYTNQLAMLNSHNMINRLNELPDIATIRQFDGKLEPVEVKHACMGLNACKGQGRSDHGFTNDCAGQGYCSTANVHSCHTLNDCKHQGGCGLYGTTEEQSNPGGNACRGHGSCATPINAERFATADGVERKSVWKMARHAFEERMNNEGKIFGNPPSEAYQDVNGENEMVGPSNKFLSDNGCYAACGSSGMSGGGSCS